MSNRNEIIERLENLAKHAVHYVGEPPFVMSLDDGIALREGIALLKAQEPVEPIIETHWETPSVYDNDVEVTENKCGACGAEIDKCDKYCRNCGRAVKWE